MAEVRVMRRTERGEMEEVEAEPQIMTEELAELIGMRFDPVIWEVEKGAIRRYAQAIEDPNPLYNDVEYARRSKYGELICPPGFFGWPVKPRRLVETPRISQIVEKAGCSRIFAGGSELEFMLPVRVRDTLTSIRKIADIYEEIGRSGKACRSFPGNLLLGSS